MNTRVMNKHTYRVTLGEGPDDVYIGRPGPWGNPFVIGKDGTRAEVIEKYRAWLLNGWNKGSPPAAAWAYQNLHKLKGKTLVCWCAPQACHGDVLMELTEKLHG